MKFENLKKFRESLGLKQEEFARPLGINKTTYSNYEVGARDPKSDFWIIVAKTYHVDIDYLLGLTDAPRSSVDTTAHLLLEEKEHINKYRTLDDHGKDIVDTVLDKEYDRVQLLPEKEAQIIEFEELLEFVEPVSAGFGIHMDTIGSSKPVQVISNIYTRKADYILRVSGNSMEPKYHNGDKILVQEVSDVDIGEIGVWMIDGRGFVKQKADGALLSLNPEYDPIYPMDSWQQVCQGRVLGLLDPAWVVEE